MRLIGEYRGSRIEYELKEAVTVVGRSGTNGLILPSQTVSRLHAEVRVQGEQVMVCDTGSLNGTRINDLDVKDETPLLPGDVVEFGSVRLKLVDGEPGTGNTMSAVAWSDEDSLSSNLQLSSAELEASGSITGAIDPKIFRLLAEAGQLLVLPESPRETFDRLLELVEGVIPAGRIIILETDEAGEPVQRAARVSGDRALSPLLLSRTMVRLVLEERKSILTSDAQSDERFMNQQSIVAQDLRSAMAVPLIHHNDTLGVLYVDTSDPLTGYGESDLQVLTLLGQMLGAKIANTRLLEVSRERDRLEEELRTAATIQRRLLPQTLPEVGGYEIVGSQETCEAVGGDLYDAEIMPDGRLQIVLGDVSGKGIPAALLMSDVLAMIRALRPFSLPISGLVERLHQHVLGRTEAERYLTLFVAEIDHETHRIDYVNAGHPPPRLVHADGSVEKLDTTGVWVGLVDLPGVEYSMKSVDFPAGSSLIITSDGIDEAGRGDDEFYGDRRFDAMLPEWAGSCAADLSAKLLADVESFRGKTPAGDDVTLLVVHRTTD